MAMAHLADILADAKASPARKDKAARLILTHADSGPRKSRRAAAAAAPVAPRGKKEVAREEAANVGTDSKWTGLLQ